MKDLDGLEPSIYMVTTNRSAGKTTDLLIRALKQFKEKKRKTILIYRNQYELCGAYSIFKGVLDLYHNLGTSISELSRSKGLFYELLLDDEPFGYAVSLSNVDSIKKYSPLFFDVDLCILDEFQKEDGRYLKNEVKKLESLLITVARGGGEQARPIKCFLLGNNVSQLNPYFIYFGVNQRYKKGTKYIRGHGWIAEFVTNASATNAIKKSGLYRAFNDDYMKMSAENAKLFQEDAFLEKCTGKCKYLFTIKHDGKYWGVRESLTNGKTFINENYDKSCKNVLVFSTGEHGSNTIMLNKNSFIGKKLKESYQLGLLRFSSLNAKNVIYDILALDFSK